MRTHVVLVPGFGGFDALGELRYYNGVTERLQAWNTGRDSQLALHYFDNLPTAGVETRAKRLRRFLAKLVERDIVQGGDRIVLGGHSTGGLDIRKVLRDLDLAGEAELLDRIHKVAFLSVPHRGTNIADWVKRHGRARELLVEAFRLTVRTEMDLPSRLMRLWGAAEPHLPQLPQFVDKITKWLVPGTSQLIAALEDVRCDFQPHDPHDPLEQADARLARSEVSLWVDDIDHDFFAIDDLASAACNPKRLVESLDHDL
jgi:triacylglycerol lipase